MFCEATSMPNDSPKAGFRWHSLDLSLKLDARDLESKDAKENGDHRIEQVNEPERPVGDGQMMSVKLSLFS
jgi:hypothetical protein